MTRITSKGQVTIPKEARDALGLQPGSEAEFIVQPEGGVLLRKASIRSAIDAWAGYLTRRVGPATTEELMEDLRGPLDLQAGRGPS